jgi:hypothetical protein
MWSKSLDKTTTSTNANEFAKQDFKHISAEGFAEIYKKAFIEYINNRQSKNAVMHVEDIAIENSSFAEAFYVIAGAIYEIGK